MKIYPIGLFIVFLLLSCQPSTVEYTFQDPSLSFDERVEDLISQLTLEEKISQLLYDAPAIDRLGIPAYNWWNEALHGQARSGRATVFPQAIGLAATWDKGLMFRVATAISDEARAKYNQAAKDNISRMYLGLSYWSPNINIFRDPRWGRGQETYGEDPYLTGQMGIQFVKGMQGNHEKYLKVIATPKHYAVHSGPEPERHTFDADVSDIDLRETYLPAFKACVTEAGAYSVMCAYNSFRGEPCCSNEFLLQEILRDEWGFQGYVVSDCGAIKDIHKNHNIVETAAEASARAVRAGCDLNCTASSWSDEIDTYLKLKEAVEQGLITEEELNIPLRRLFHARFKLGMFDPAENVPYSDVSMDVVDSEPHRELSLEAARKSLVLLKNENNLLPLSKDIQTLAVIGPNAHDMEVLLGNYHADPYQPVTPLKGIKDKVPDANILYARGGTIAEGIPAFEVIPGNALQAEIDGETQQGLKGTYYDNSEFDGEPVMERVDSIVNFRWISTSPAASIPNDDYGIVWSGKIIPPVSGEYTIGGFGYIGWEMFINGEKHAQFFNVHEARPSYNKIRLEKGKEYNIEIKYINKYYEGHFQLMWERPGVDYETKAIEKAKQADAVVLVMGIHPWLEGEEMNVPVEGFEGGDRISIDLPENQQQLIKKIVALGKPVVLVLMNGSALAINWEDENIAAIVEAWYTGQEAGTAIADVLFGDYNPGGRLPMTFYKSVNQLPPFRNYAMEGRTYKYFEDEPIYPFGYGLSYSTFSYTSLQVPESQSANELVQISVEVSNTGDMAGEEVVQVYVSDKDASVPVPNVSLKDFERVQLQAGETKSITFTLPSQAFSIFLENGEQTVEPGEFEIYVGGVAPVNGSEKALTTEFVKKTIVLH